MLRRVQNPNIYMYMRDSVFFHHSPIYCIVHEYGCKKIIGTRHVTWESMAYDAL